MVCRKNRTVWYVPLVQRLRKNVQCQVHVRECWFQTSPCSECCILPSGWFPSACIYVPIWSWSGIFRIIMCVLQFPSHRGELFLISNFRLWRWNRRCSETSAHKIQMPGDHPKERIRHVRDWYLSWTVVLWFVFYWVHLLLDILNSTNILEEPAAFHFRVEYWRQLVAL